MAGAAPVKPYTYADVGATRDADGACPDGFRALRVRTRVGYGAEAHRIAGRAVLGWAMHRGLGLTVDAGTESAAPGVEVVVGIGVGRWRVQAPCRVVWAVDEPGRVGFAYGTLTGHPECGEEAFVVETDAEGRVWMEVRAFSRPAAWYARAGGPVTRLVQHACAKGYGLAVRRVVARQVRRSRRSTT
ncbi:DUF1990 domain-containing protein [Streptomyces finlayi]|uniref:DUF1990 domain-containing protein n=1 Tax=Streptomyces finlayi TaxID=67296 RepID=A0A918WSH1_9ACTN|nr:DUF1990 domain-containing protein [Streptomyces finlayi]GHC78517.1 DUF1990 domain-containing protein [Streptomyces finlayi]